MNTYFPSVRVTISFVRSGTAASSATCLPRRSRLGYAECVDGCCEERPARTGMVTLSVRAGPHLLERLFLSCRLDLAPRTVAHNLLHPVRLGQQGCQANELLQPRLVLLV